MINMDTLGKRIGLGYVIVAVLLAIAVGTTLWQTAGVSRLSEDIREQRVPEAMAALRVLNGINESLAALRGWVIMEEDRFKDDRAVVWQDQIHFSMKRLEQLIARGNSGSDVKAIKSDIRRLERYQEEIEALAHTEASQPALTTYREQVLPLHNKIIVDLNELMEQEEEKIKTGSDGDHARMLLYEEIVHYQTHIEELQIAVGSYLLDGSAKMLKRVQAALMVIIPGSHGTSCQLPCVSRACRPGSLPVTRRVIRLMSSWAAARTPGRVGG